jgi:hypothetical protein
MIVTIALAFIGALMVLANYKFLRKIKTRIIIILISGLIASVGVYLLINSPKDLKPWALTPLFTPISALFLFLISRAYWLRTRKQEIILYIKGFYPIKHEERFVSKLEINITIAITFFAIIIPLLSLGGITDIIESIK